MILVWLILIPAAGAVLSWFVARTNGTAARWVSLLAMLLDLALVVVLWAGRAADFTLVREGQWVIETRGAWIPQFGIGFHFAMDGLSLLMVALTALIGALSVLASWSEITERVGFFHFNLLWVLAGVNGVFLSIDLFLFYFFWEMMLIPMYFLIAIWGHENRIYAAIKFFLFTQASGLFMLLAILALFFIHYRVTGTPSFDYMDLLGTSLDARTGTLLMLGFFLAFAVKLPAFPFHTWLPDAHTEAPTAGSVVLAALMLKTGAYGFLRFVIPLFPEASARFAPIAMLLGVFGIVYGAVQAFGQNDLKRLVAYTSVSHLGFVLLGAFAAGTLALQGVIMQMITHAFSTGALFVLVGALQERIHTRDMDRMGGLWKTVPRMGGVGMFFALASLGLPGLGNFVAEALTLFGSYSAAPVLTVIAATGLVGSTVYALWLVQRAFHGEEREPRKIPDLSARHMIIFAAMMLALLWLGLYPRPVLDAAGPAVQNIESSMHPSVRAALPAKQAEGFQEGTGE